MKLKDLEKKYGVDFGKDSEMEVADYLRKKGYKNLAESFKTVEKKARRNK